MQSFVKVAMVVGASCFLMFAGCETRRASVSAYGGDRDNAYGGHVEVDNRDQPDTVYVERDRPQQVVVRDNSPDVVVIDRDRNPDVVVVDRTPDVIIVRERPPAVRVEKRPVAPGREYIWIDGYWIHRGGRFTWVSGHWERQRQGHRYVNARWEQTRDGQWSFRAGVWIKN